MRRDTLIVSLPDGRTLALPVVSVNTLIIGAGAAALKCAQSLHDLGVRDAAVVVDRLGAGRTLPLALSPMIAALLLLAWLAYRRKRFVRGNLG
jgi:hypothetical protein